MKEKKATIKLRYDEPLEESPLKGITWFLDTLGLIKSRDQGEVLPRMILHFVEAMKKGERIKAKELVGEGLASPSTVHKYLRLLRDAEIIVSRGAGYYELSKINFEDIVKEKQYFVNRTFTALKNVSRDIDTMLQLDTAEGAR
jgi:hypothetical protein